MGDDVLAYDDLTRAIQARHLQTPMAEATSVDVNAETGTAARLLRRGPFDFAPAVSDGTVRGYVKRLEIEEVSGRCARFVRPLDLPVLVSAQASVLEVMEALGHGPGILFVIDGRRMSGLITSSDLNKGTARVHFYLLLARLEVSLTAVVRAIFTDQEAAVALLDKEAAKKVQGRHKRDVKNDVAIDLVTGMDLADLLRIAGCEEGVRSKFGIRDADEWQRTTADLPDLRRCVAHPDLGLLQSGRMVAELVAIERVLRSLVLAADAEHEATPNL